MKKLGVALGFETPKSCLPKLTYAQPQKYRQLLMLVVTRQSMSYNYDFYYLLFVEYEMKFYFIFDMSLELLEK